MVRLFEATYRIYAAIRWGFSLLRMTKNNYMYIIPTYVILL